MSGHAVTMMRGECAGMPTEGDAEAGEERKPPTEPWLSAALCVRNGGAAD